MADLVAWSTIQAGQAGEGDKPGEVKVIKPGESVSQGDLGLDDDQFKQLLDSGAVRSLAYPDMPETFQGSPVEFMREQARIASEEAIAGVEVSEENADLMAAASRAATGTPEPAVLDADVQKEMDKQMADQGGEAPKASTAKSSSSSSGSGSS